MDKEQLQAELLQWLKNVTDTELPAAAREIIQFQATVDTVILSVSAIGLVVCLLVGVWAVGQFNKPGNYSSGDGGGYLLTALLCGFLGFIALLFTIGSSYDLYKVKTAPRLVIIEHIR